MQSLELIDSQTWSLSSIIPTAHPFFMLNTHTLLNTWIAMGLLTVLLLIGRFVVTKEKSLGRYTIITALQFLLDIYNQAFTTYSTTHFAFITTIFLFIFFCNSISLIPWTEEPTTDLNTALALGIVAFVYAQAVAIKIHGIKEYIGGYFQPFFVFFPLNVVSKLASIISISFRLFGNIFGGAIIAKLYTSAISGVIIFELLGIVSTINIVIALFFGLFEGFLQAFVFTMLTTTTIALAVQGEKPLENYMIHDIFHYCAIASAVSINAFTVGLGQGLTSIAALRAVNIQPSSNNEINKTALFGMALIETTAVLGLFISLILLSGSQVAIPGSFKGVTELAIVLALCLPGLALGIASALPAQAACMAIARQPFSAQKIMRFMMITISLIQTPIIFGFIVSLIIHAQGAAVFYWRDALRIMGSGLAIGLGSIGPAFGLGLFTQKACGSLGINRKSHESLFSYTLIRIAVIETPLIFALVVSIMLLFLVPQAHEENIIQGIAFLCAGLTVGLGTFGAGLSSARTAASAALQIALNPLATSTLSQTSMLGQGVIEASVIYPTIIAFFLIFFNIK